MPLPRRWQESGWRKSDKEQDHDTERTFWNSPAKSNGNLVILAIDSKNVMLFFGI